MSTNNSIVNILEAIAETAGAIGDTVQLDIKIDTPVDSDTENSDTKKK